MNQLKSKPLVLACRLLVTSALLSLSIAASGALAAEGDDPAGEIANKFAEAVSGGILEEKIPGGFNLGGTGADQYLNAGYYKILVKKIGNAQNDAVVKSKCHEILASHAAASRPLSFVTGSDDEVGMSLTLFLQPSATPAPEDPRAEVNLFRLYRQDGGKCGLQQSYFALKSADAPFESPLIPLELQPGADQVATVQFSPWIARVRDPNRITALWRGVGAFAKLLGPVGSFVSVLLGEEDPYAVRSQARASFFGDAALAPGDEIVKASSARLINRPLNIAPLPGSDLSRNRIVAQLGFAPKSTPQDRLSLGYTVEVAYVGTRFPFPGPGFKPLSEADFDTILNAPSPFAKKKWEEVTPSVANLRAQKTVAAFSAACGPAFEELKNLNLSHPDRALLIYAVGRKNAIYPGEFNEIPCFKDSLNRKALARFGIKIPEPVITVPAARREAAMEHVRKGFKSPTNAAQRNGGGLVDVVLDDGRFSISGQTALLTRDRSSINGDGLLKAEFLNRFKKLYQVQTGCALTDWGSDFMPDSAGGLSTEVKPVAFLAVQPGAKDYFLVVLGLSKQLNSIGNPSLLSMWIGTTTDQSDIDVQEIKRLMSELEACKSDANFAGFIAAQAAAAAPPPVTPALNEAPVVPADVPGALLP